MKKFYVGVVALVCSMSLFAEGTVSIVSLTLTDLTHDRLNTSYTDSKGNKITISTTEPQYKGADTFIYGQLTSGDNPLACLGLPDPGTASQYGIFTLKGNMGAPYAQSPSILIEFPKSGNITDVQITGRSAGGSASYILSGFSWTGTAEMDFNVNWDDPNEEYIPYFVFPSNICATVDHSKREVPLQEDTEKPAKYLQLAVSEYAFDNAQLTDMNSAPQVYAIRFFAKDTGTSVELNEQTALDIQLYGRNLQLSEVADVAIYDITGKVVAQYNDIESAYLGQLNGGIYVISATTLDGVKVNQKMVIK